MYNRNPEDKVARLFSLVENVSIDQDDFLDKLTVEVSNASSDEVKVFIEESGGDYIRAIDNAQLLFDAVMIRGCMDGTDQLPGESQRAFVREIMKAANKTKGSRNSRFRKRTSKKSEEKKCVVLHARTAFRGLIKSGLAERSTSRKALRRSNTSVCRENSRNSGIVGKNDGGRNCKSGEQLDLFKFQPPFIANMEMNNMTDDGNFDCDGG